MPMSTAVVSHGTPFVVSPSMSQEVLAFLEDTLGKSDTASQFKHRIRQDGTTFKVTVWYIGERDEAREFRFTLATPKSAHYDWRWELDWNRIGARDKKEFGDKSDRPADQIWRTKVQEAITDTHNLIRGTRWVSGMPD